MSRGRARYIPTLPPTLQTSEVRAVSTIREIPVTSVTSTSSPKAQRPPVCSHGVPSLEAETVREALGEHPEPRDLAIIRFDVRAAIYEMQAAVAAGTLPPRRLVWGRPLADWVSLDAVALLLREARA